MNDCKYCGASNPATVFNCLKCNAMMPVQPAPVQNISVVQQRKPIAVKVHAPAPITVQPPANQYPVTQMSWKELGIYFGASFGTIAFVALIFLMLYFIEKRQPVNNAQTIKPTSAISVSTTPTIKSNGGILLATTEENFAEMMRAAVSGDDAYLMRMSDAGKLFRLQDGTKIRIIEGGMVKSKVSAIEGTQAGKSGWLPNEFIAQ